MNGVQKQEWWNLPYSIQRADEGRKLAHLEKRIRQFRAGRVLIIVVFIPIVLFLMYDGFIATTSMLGHRSIVGAVLQTLVWTIVPVLLMGSLRFRIRLYEEMANQIRSRIDHGSQA